MIHPVVLVLGILLSFAVPVTQQITFTLPGSPSSPPPDVVCLLCAVLSPPLFLFLSAWCRLEEVCFGFTTNTLSRGKKTGPRYLTSLVEIWNSQQQTGNVCLPHPVFGRLEVWRCWQRIKQQETTGSYNPPVLLDNEMIGPRKQGSSGQIFCHAAACTPLKHFRSQPVLKDFFFNCQNAIFCAHVTFCVNIHAIHTLLMTMSEVTDGQSESCAGQRGLGDEDEEGHQGKMTLWSLSVLRSLGGGLKIGWVNID